jgi:hypothetical protein
MTMAAIIACLRSIRLRSLALLIVLLVRWDDLPKLFYPLFKREYNENNENSVRLLKDLSAFVLQGSCRLEGRRPDTLHLWRLTSAVSDRKDAEHDWDEDIWRKRKLRHRGLQVSEVGYICPGGQQPGAHPESGHGKCWREVEEGSVAS